MTIKRIGSHKTGEFILFQEKSWETFTIALNKLGSIQYGSRYLIKVIALPQI